MRRNAEEMTSEATTNLVRRLIVTADLDKRAVATYEAEAAAADLARAHINARLGKIENRLIELKNAIPRRTNVSRLHKAVSAIGGRLILGGFLPSGVRLIGLSILIASIVYLLFGNHQTLIGKLNERNRLEQLKEPVDEANGAAVNVM